MSKITLCNYWKRAEWIASHLSAMLRQRLSVAPMARCWHSEVLSLSIRAPSSRRFNLSQWAKSITLSRPASAVIFSRTNASEQFLCNQWSPKHIPTNFAVPSQDLVPVYFKDLQRNVSSVERNGERNDVTSSCRDLVVSRDGCRCQLTGERAAITCHLIPKCRGDMASFVLKLLARGRFSGQ